MSTAGQARPPRRARADAASTKSAEVTEPFLDPEDREDPISHLPQVLNRDEMLSLVKKYATEIEEAVSIGEAEREKAVRAKDAIKLACIQDRLANLKIMKRLSDERVAASERNRIRDDELNLRHEFRGVELAHQRVVKLRTELVSCMGESLEVTIGGGNDRLVPTTEDPTGAHLPPTPIDRPPPASPYQ